MYICHFWRFENLASHNPGNIFHARWLTIASRLLKIYIGYIKSPENLRLLVEFIVKVYRYAPTWLALKKISSHLDPFIYYYSVLQISPITCTGKYNYIRPCKIMCIFYIQKIYIKKKKYKKNH